MSIISPLPTPTRSLRQQPLDNVYRADYPAFYEHLVVGRNRAWVGRIQEMMREGAAAFVVVGTGHLVGSEGLPVLLERAGIAARPV